MTTQSKPTAESTMTQTVWRGRFVWYDLMTTDVPAATKFYKKIAGWGTQEFDMGSDRKYQMWTVGDVPIGGVVPITPEMGAPGTPPHWMGHVAVPDVDETVKQAKALGGKVHSPPRDIPSVGRFAVIADPQAATIAVYTPLKPAEAKPFQPKVGEFSWHELMTTDHQAAFSFYSKLFDWEKQGTFDMGGAMGEYLMFGQGREGPVVEVSMDYQPKPSPADDPMSRMYGGMFTMTPDMQMPPSWWYYIHVESVDGILDKVKSLGGEVMNGPMDVPGGSRIAQCKDPQGAIFAVQSMKKD